MKQIQDSKKGVHFVSSRSQREINTERRQKRAKELRKLHQKVQKRVDRISS